MNHKQKLGYMALGAGILAIGIIIGQFVTPDIEAQSNGVFDKITCREIEVIDKGGETAIRLHTTKHGGDIRLDSKDGRIATMSIDERGGSIYLSGKGKGPDGGIVSMYTSEDYASLDVKSRALSDGGIGMAALYDAGYLEVKGAGLFDQGAVEIRINSRGGRVRVAGKGGVAAMGTDEHGGRLDVFNRNKQFNHQALISENNRQLNHRAVMGVNEHGNGAVSTWDKNGYRQ